jgi:hypothetical protein
VRPGGIRLNWFLTRDHQKPMILLGSNPKLEPPQNYKIVCGAKIFMIVISQMVFRKKQTT